MPPGVEIERKFLLSGLPPIPAGAERWRIEQGYLSPLRPTEGVRPSAEDLEFSLGRLRVAHLADARAAYTHTIKSGMGLQRLEQEREITADEFDRHWPRTEGRRLRKTRWRIPHGAVTWEIDDIENGWIALAEVELETPDQSVTPPQWLAPLIVREVTDDPAYTNSALAQRVSTLW